MNSRLNNIFSQTDCLSEEVIIKYLQGKLSSSEKHLVERHLIDCEMCSDAMEGLKMIGAKQKIQVITSDINHQIELRTSPKKAKVFFLEYRTQLAAAAAVILLAGLFFLLKDNLNTEKETFDKTILADKLDQSLAGNETDEKEIIKDANARTETNLSPLKEENLLNDVFTSGKDVGLKKDTSAVYFSSDASRIVPAEKKPDVPALQDEGIKKLKEKEKHHRFQTKSIEDDYISADEVMRDKEESSETDIRANKEKTDAGKIRWTLEEPVVSKTGAVLGGVASSATIPEKTENAKQQQADDSKKKKNISKDEPNYASAEIKTKKKTKVKSGGRTAVRTFSGKKLKSVNIASKKESASPSSPEQTAVAPSSPPPVQDADVATFEIQTQNLDNADSVSVNVSQPAGIEQAIVQYNNKDFSGAAAGFEEALKKNPNNEKALYYSGLSYLQLNQANKAITNFNKILQNKNSPYYDEAQWHVSLVFIQKNDQDNARRNLMELRDNSKSRYRKQAGEILLEMDKK